MTEPRRLLFRGARLVDPASGLDTLDATGDLLVADGRVAGLGGTIKAADAV